jgi:hypothetical protein
MQRALQALYAKMAPGAYEIEHDLDRQAHSGRGNEVHMLHLARQPGPRIPKIDSGSPRTLRFIHGAQFLE